MAHQTEMQSRLLEMMKFFHDYCEANNLRYYTVGGTTLGAIRHGGFIPWDDDIDVGMPRKDYEKLIQIFGSVPREGYVIESIYSNNEDFYYAYSKLYDTTTTLIENTKTQVKRGMYIDIFPLDGAGGNEDEALKHYEPIDKKKKLLGLRTIKINTRRTWYKNILLYIVQAMPDAIISEKRLCNQIDSLCKRLDFDNSVFVGNLTGAWGKKEIMPRELFGKPTLHAFESIQVYVQEDTNGYLTHLYGDWRKLPPEEKRVSHHGYYLDLHRSYLE